MLFEVIVVSVLLTVLLSLLLHLITSRKIIRNLDTLPFVPIVGNGHLFINNTPAELLLYLDQLLKKHNKRFQAVLGTDLVVFTSDIKDFEPILSSNSVISKAREYDVLRNWLGDGLLLSSGRKWHSHRKAITPAFHFKILDQYVEIFDQQSNTLVEKLSVSDTKTVDIYPMLTLMALDVICESAMGARVNAQLNSDSKYVKAVKEVARILHLRMFDLLLRGDFYYQFTALAKQEKGALKIIHSFTDSVIAARRKELKAKKSRGDNGNATDHDDFGIKRKMNLMDVLLETTCDGQPLSDQEIREEVDTFMFEGHDTTTSALSFALYMLANNPRAQELAYEEACQVLGSPSSRNGPLSLHQLNELHYLELCIKETLRLFPSVPFIARKATEEITFNNITVKPGTSITLASFFMHRDPDYYSDPEEFRPERFLEDRSTDKSSPYSYVPFSAGPRNCIGQKFAMYEMKSVISKVLLNYKITVDKSFKGPVLVAELILKPETGLLLNFSSRKWDER